MLIEQIKEEKEMLESDNEDSGKSFLNTASKFNKKASQMDNAVKELTEE
jgi:hypothetical protein